MASRASAYALAIFSENPLVGEAPQSPGKGRFVALPNAPQVGRLRALAGAEYGRLDRLERSMLTASGRMRRRPVRGDEKDRRWRLFYGVWGRVPNKRVAGVCTLMPCLPRLFSVVLGFPPRMKIALA